MDNNNIVPDPNGEQLKAVRDYNNIKITKTFPCYLIAFALMIGLSFIAYNIGLKNGYSNGFNNGSREIIQEFKDNDYTMGYASCYLETLGSLSDVNVGWYILKVDTMENEGKADNIKKSDIWKAYFKDQKPLSITRGAKMQDENMYFVKNDSIWFKENNP